MAAESQVVLLGFPDAGKTTFLGAFFVETERSSGPDAVITRYTDADREYLNRLADSLADRKSVARTPQDQPDEMRLHLQFAGSETERLVVVPDISGEVLTGALEARVMDDALVENIKACDGALLFVRADTLQEVVELRLVAGLLRDAEGDEVGDDEAEHPDDWHPGLAAPQARLVDAVQQTLALRGGGSPLRIGVVISAWDTTGDERSPERWAGEHLPLLTQLLDHEPRVEYAVFGVAAQGGDFRNEQDRVRLGELELADRAQARNGAGDMVRVTAPLRWVLGD